MVADGSALGSDRLNREAALPLYAQLQQKLRELVANGASGDGRFYTDQKICAMFGVSRSTARQAIQDLVAAGVLRRVQGQGTFINAEKAEEVFGPRMDFLDQWARIGRPVEMQLLEFGPVSCPIGAALQLGIEPGTPTLKVVRYRKSGGAIISHDTRLIHPDYASHITREDASRQSLLVNLSRSVALAFVDNRLEAGRAGREASKLLGTAPGDAIMVRELIYYGSGSIPIMCGRSLYPGENVRHAFRVSLEVPARPIA
ncbi:MAG: GntR family transcriptional regulator [Lautropia sp.]